MKIHQSGAALSKIVQIGEKLKQLTALDGKEYLPLNRGVNSVVNIDLSKVVAGLDFNSAQMQVYPPTTGFAALREAINVEYFCGQSDKNNILLTAGGINALDLLIGTLEIEKLFLPVYYWGSYFHILTLHGVGKAEYEWQGELCDRLDDLRGNAVLICDPGNPMGEKYDDQAQFQVIKTLSDAGVTVIFDSPYRRVFTDSQDRYYCDLLALPNVIITESFSKSVGLSGQRLGFIHSTDRSLTDELTIRLMYNTNGVNAFAQLVVLSLLTTAEGREAVTNFKRDTTRDIALNIDYLQQRGLLAEQFYSHSSAKGIFVIVNRTEQQLLDAQIGSVSLTFFTKSRKDSAQDFARICVSTPHDKFKAFFDKLK